jgi:hypothetical protein
MSSLRTRHPNDEQLLHFADGEMTASQTEEIRSHLKSCWECRSELEGIEQTIGECVRYRHIVLDACLPAPPEPWFDIYPRLARIDESEKRRRWISRVVEPLAAALRKPSQWVPAVATLLLVTFAVQQFRHAPSVQAAELLRKAVAAAESNPRALRRIQIRTRTGRLTRVVGGSATVGKKDAGADSMAGLEEQFRAAHYSWEDPLSAKAYSDWRDQLAEKSDEVTLEPDRYRLRTTTDSGEIIEATLKLSLPDLRTVESTLQFRNREWVTISELPDIPAQDVSKEAPVTAAAAQPHSSKPDQPMELPAAATPGEELAVWLALHRLGADLGDPVEVTRSREAILVTGTGIAPGRQQAIREQLRMLPRVTVALSSEPLGEDTGLEGRNPSRIAVVPGTGRLQTEMERQLGGRAAFEQFADRILDMTDAVMSRAHALRRLAERFPPDAESEMTLQQRQLLDGLCREHAEALLRSVTEIEGGIGPVLGTSSGAAQEVKAPGTWQDEAEQLFGEARHAETMLVALLGASVDEIQSPELPAQVAASLARLRKRAENYERLSIGP